MTGAARRAFGAVRRDFAPWRDPAARPFIRFEGVTKRFGDVAAVDGLTLDIFEREFFCLLGPSGCGKTTLMRLLAGFEAPTGGRILLDGHDMAGIAPYRRPVNMMFQSYALFPHMSVEKNVAFGLKRDGLPKDEIAARVGEMLRLVRLEAQARRKPHQLSGGQRQRVALARALAKRPKVLLLDEPLGALDRKLREETQFELMDIQAELATTFVVVTHDQEEAMILSDRIAVMDQGRIVQVGPPGDVYEAPNSRYVADFIGDINMLEGRAVSVSGSMVEVESAEVGARIVAVCDVAPDEGARVWLALRPEKCTISTDKPAEAVNCVEGEVWDIGYLGDWTVYRVHLASGAMLKVSQANRARRAARPITWQDRVWVSWERDAAMVLTR